MKDLKSYIISRSKEHGFLAARFAKAEKMDNEERKLEQWLNQGLHGKMHYMENHFDLRVDPRKLVPGTKTVVSFLFNYYPQEEIETEDNYKIAKYAYGKDYHKLIRKKLKNLLEEIKEEFGDINGRGFVDSAPILERDWAKRSGLGWIGKNTLLLSKQLGSYFFLAELLLDVDIEPDPPVIDHCGTCTACIHACPTDAIHENGYWLDASKCISYLTIELKENIPNEFKDSMEDWVFGCDICQDVCPWNRFSKPTHEEKFHPKEELQGMKKKDWEQLTEETFDRLFNGTAVRRTKFEGLKRNISFIKKEE